jgi:L-amino acid N-acyltransferase YncA
LLQIAFFIPIPAAVSMLTIRPATPADEDSLWQIMEPIIRAGETYDFPRDTTRAAALAAWMNVEGFQCFVAEDEQQRVLGTYVLHANRQGGGSHVANCGYMTAANATGQGVARAMCADSLDTARAQGFRAMQFNFVIASNHRAVKLWTSMGFETVGRLPGAFLHPVHGYVDAMVMFQTL